MKRRLAVMVSTSLAALAGTAAATSPGSAMLAGVGSMMSRSFAGANVPNGSTSLRAQSRIAYRGSPSAAVVRAPAGDDPCGADVAGIIIHDDGSAENGYGWNDTVTDGAYVDKFTPSAYPATFSSVCLATITTSDLTSLPIHVVVYAADGDGGAPGTLLGSADAMATPDALGVLPFTPAFQSFDISDLAINVTAGDVYIGLEWDASSGGGNTFYVDADESTTTADAGGYSSGDGGMTWTALDTNATFPNYRALMVRAVEAEGAPPASAPTLAKSFTPDAVATATDSVVTLTLTNPGTTDATLTADLVDTLPTGVVATADSAATTCTGGAGASTDGASVTLATDAVIPAGGDCTVTVTVQAADAGTYVNTIPAGGLVTDQGASADDASATLTVGGGSGDDNLFCSGFENGEDGSCVM